MSYLGSWMGAVASLASVEKQIFYIIILLHLKVLCVIFLEVLLKEIKYNKHNLVFEVYKIHT